VVALLPGNVLLLIKESGKYGQIALSGGDQARVSTASAGRIDRQARQASFPKLSGEGIRSEEVMHLEKDQRQYIQIDLRKSASVKELGIRMECPDFHPTTVCNHSILLATVQLQ
jgi:hypothetical protein